MLAIPLRPRFQLRGIQRWLWVIGIVGTLTLYLWAFRWIWFATYQPQVLQELYEHSQWKITLSTRIMGDGDLYQYAAHDLIKGGNPFLINPEVPVLGKYFYGLSILWFHNAYPATVLFYFGSLVGFWWVSQGFFVRKDDSARHIAFLLFLLSPLFFSQMGQIGLDLPQLFFLLLHVGSMWQITREQSQRRRIGWIVLSGALLGGFAAIKFALFAPLLALLACWWLWRYRLTKLLPIFFLSAGLVYPLTYLPYFVQGHSLAEWVSAQKWIVNFYLGNKVAFLPFMVFITLLTGLYSGWWQNPTIWVTEWTLLWPTATLTTLFQIWRQKPWQNWQKRTDVTTTKPSLITKKTFSSPLSVKKAFHAINQKQVNAHHLYTIVLAAGLLLMNAVIPFWPRYLVLVLPWLILECAAWLMTVSRKWRTVLLVVCAIQAIYALFPPPDNLVRVADEALQNQSYPELYNLLQKESQYRSSRTDFVTSLQAVDTKLNATQKTVTITMPWTWPWQTQQTGDLIVEYTTPLGVVSHRGQVTFVRENNDWKIAWDWNSILPHYSTDSEIVVQSDPYETGLLLTSDNVQLSTGGAWPFLNITPSAIPAPADSLLTDLTELTALPVLPLRVKLFVTSNPASAVPVGFILPNYNPTTLARVKEYSAVKVTDLPARVYNPTLVSRTDTDHQYVPTVQSIEAQHPELFGKAGGKILIRNGSQTYIIFNAPTQNGVTVKLDKSFADIFGMTLLEMEKKN